MRSCLIAVFLLAAPTFAAAQDATAGPHINAGTRVRIWSDSTTQLMKARVFASDPTGLTLQPNLGTPSQRLQLSELHRIDVSRGRNRLAWTAMGILVGATTGVILTRLGDREGDVSGLDGLAEGFANTISGMLVGGIVGFFVAPERWRTVWSR